MVKGVLFLRFVPAILKVFLTNTNILVTKVGRIGKNPILGTSCGRGLKLTEKILFIQISYLQTCG
jgi:hypothetical protein